MCAYRWMGVGFIRCIHPTGKPVWVFCLFFYNDPTAHAEVNVIRQACKKLKTYDLSEYELYATGYPCPMCMSAIIWANIKKIYVCASYQEAAKIGFRDSHISNFLKNDCQDGSILNIVQLDDSKVKELYKQYTNLHKKIY